MWYVLTLSVLRETNINFLTLFIQNEQGRFQEWMCLKRRPKNEDRRPKTLWSKTKSLWSKTKTQQSKTFFFHQGKKERGKDCKRDRLDSYFISVGTTRVKLRNAVIFRQKYRNIICHGDLVCFVVTNFLFLKCISENYDEVTLLPSYIYCHLISVAHT